MGKTVSYRVDALSFTVNPYENLEKEMALAGYELREPEDDEAIRVARGYKKEDAKILDIAPMTKYHNDDDFMFAFTVQTRNEREKPRSGFIAMSGEQLDYIDYKNLLMNLGNILKGTRVDIACDIEYGSKKEMSKAQRKLNRLVGFDPIKNNGKYTHNPVNDILPGNKKGSKKITTASITASNGETLYIGGRQSKFMVRVYDKSEEVKARTNEDIPPTLRIEIEAKKEVASSVIKHIINGSNPDELWHTLMDDHLKFTKGSMSEIMEIDKAEKVTLDYSKIEGESLELWAWIDRQVAPAIKKDEVFKKMSREEKIEKLIKHFL